jgi:hypothetical protein
LEKLTLEAATPGMKELKNESVPTLQVHQQHWSCFSSPATIPVPLPDWATKRVAGVFTTSPQSAHDQSESFSPYEGVPSPVSEANIRLVNRATPAPSSVSIDRYLTTPACYGMDVSLTAHAAMKRALLDHLDSPPSATRPERPSSIVGSDSSMNSRASNTSWASHRSTDPRGSPRGRKVWVMPHKVPTPPKVPAPSISPAPRNNPPIFTSLVPTGTIDATTSPFLSRTLVDTSQAKGEAEPKKDDKDNTVRQIRSTKAFVSAQQPYFCTWQDCKETFRHRYEWARHEEAMHYCPYHWVCCLNDLESGSTTLASCFLCEEGAVTCKHVMDHVQFQSCSNKDAASRSFLRKDHLTQHIKRTHLAPHKRAQLRPSDFRKLLSAWKIDNPVMSKTALFCGFCGITTESWADRQEHVAGHFLPHSLGNPVCKSSWQLDRVPT